LKMRVATTKPSSLLLIVVLLIALAGLGNAKSVSGVFHLESGDLTHGPEYEIAKFSFAIGKSKVEGRFRFADSHTWMSSPALYLFRDEVWDSYHNAPACDDKMEFAHKAIPRMVSHCCGLCLGAIQLSGLAHGVHCELA